MKKYSVDNVPLLIRPFYFLLAYFVSAIFRIYWWLLQKTCTIEIEGKQWIEKHPGRIEAVWHYKSFVYWLSKSDGKNYVQFSHPDWYMMYAIITLRWMGSEVILGSTGHEGIKAANQIVDRIKTGKACCVTPDGPFGPYKEIKKGILHMSKQSGLPIIPIRIDCDKYFQLSFAWDKKWIPKLFSTIKVSFQNPIYVTGKNLGYISQQLAIEMGD
ncbi:MAG: DUF374 domain-containing protein [Candidatus Marinimicrobia bacterium]|nr:DUF374 domain-containing protein [Candidatus Neomarinimicrobiota bacterium]